MHDLRGKNATELKKMLNTLDDVSVFLKVNHKKNSFSTSLIEIQVIKLQLLMCSE